MKRTNLLTITTLAALATSAMSTGCVEDDRTFFIRQNQIPLTACQTTTTTSLYNPRGTLDVSAKLGYWLFPLMENNLKPSASVDGQPERNSLHLRGYEVEIDLGQIPGEYPGDLLKFYDPTTGDINPGSKLDGKVKVIPDRLVQMLNIPKGLKPLVMVSIRAIAKRSGSDQESSTFIYPIDLCNGCLVDMRNSCPDTKTDKTILTNYCGTPQDSPVTCCAKAGIIDCYETAK